MKKTLMIASIVALAMISCKKDYICECTTSSNAPGNVSSTNNTTLVDVSKKAAKTNCFKSSYETTSGGATYVVTSDCKLK